MPRTLLKRIDAQKSESVWEEPTISTKACQRRIRAFLHGPKSSDLQSEKPLRKLHSFRLFGAQKGENLIQSIMTRWKQERFEIFF